MKSRVRLTLVVAGLAMGCTARDSGGPPGGIDGRVDHLDAHYVSFYISQALVAWAGCVTPAPVLDGTSPGGVLGSGLLDVSGHKGYLLFPQLEYRPLVSDPGGEPLQLREFQVNLGGIAPYPDSLLKFSIPSTALIAPNEASVFSLDGVIGDQLATQLAMVIPAGGFRTRVTVEIIASGVLSGSAIDSPVFPFSIALCNGCLVDLRPTCPSPTTPGVYTNTCGRPQDSPVTCCPSAQGVTCLKGT